MTPRGFPFKHHLGLEGSVQGRIGGSIHEEAFPDTINVNSKVGQEKIHISRMPYLNALTITLMIKGGR
jgi:hypothetical protein